MVTCLGSEFLEKESYLHLDVSLKVSKKKGFRISCKSIDYYCMKAYACLLNVLNHQLYEKQK